MARLAGDAQVIIGVDTHLDSHTAAACSSAGRHLDLLQVPATPAGYAQLLAWAQAAAAGGQLAWAIEGTGGYGAGLARFLAGVGERMIEIDRPERPHRRGGSVQSVPQADV